MAFPPERQQDERVRVGRAVPRFCAQAIIQDAFMDVSLDAYVNAGHWLVLMFFPRAWSIICPTEIRAFSARLEEFHTTRRCGVAFASTDSSDCLRAWNALPAIEGGLGSVRVPLISDLDRTLSRHFDVLVDSKGHAERAMFIIDPKGILRAMTINDTDIGRSVDEILRLVDALKHRDEYGEACPVDWKAGSAGLRLAQESSGTYKLGESRAAANGRAPDMFVESIPCKRGQEINGEQKGTEVSGVNGNHAAHGNKKSLLGFSRLAPGQKTRPSYRKETSEERRHSR